MTPTRLTLPIFPIRNTVLFPYVGGPFSAGRPRSIAALEAAANSEDKLVAVFTQRDAGIEQPGINDLFGVGTKAAVKRIVHQKDTVEVILDGIERLTLLSLAHEEPYLLGRVEESPVLLAEGTEVEAVQQALIQLVSELQSLGEGASSFEVGELAAQVQRPIQLVYLLTTMVGLDIERTQQILDAPTQLEAMKALHTVLAHELQVRRLRQEIAGQAQTEMGREQREYFLRQQLRAIHDELGENQPEQAEMEELRKQMEQAPLPEEARRETERELRRMENIPAASPERQVIRSYIDLVLELPWGDETQDNLDLARARQVLDEDHYGLDEVKERILEHLAVLKLNPSAKSPILCFVGPPGVGKTSLGKSIARALGRKFERFSLGGLHDEAELRGHRRTYIGAMPGRIIQAIRRAGVKNPLLMLDEVDKLGRDFRGDPASALLEILDPAQNYEFRDNYLDLGFDLSNVFFVCTANALDPIPGPLLDRIETLRLPGYSDEEKVIIANRYLIDRQRNEAGLDQERFSVPESTVRAVIHKYTREAGVRELERVLGRLARKTALLIAEEKAVPGEIGPEQLPELLGPERFFLEQARKALPPGVATGLAWTQTGGDVLYVEAIRLPDGDRLTLTGQLGDVMQESAKAAQNYIRANAAAFAITKLEGGVHIHVPAGAVPKDGPSAGVTMAAALASVYSQRSLRSDTAMTGEITLTGLVLPVGGIKEKVLAAHRAGIRRIVLPKQNKKDLRELPDHLESEMEYLFVERIEAALEAVWLESSTSVATSQWPLVGRPPALISS